MTVSTSSRRTEFWCLGWEVKLDGVGGSKIFATHSDALVRDSASRLRRDILQHAYVFMSSSETIVSAVD